MERKKLMLAGGLLLMAGVMFVGLQKMNQPVERIVEVTKEAPVVENVQQNFVLVAISDVPRGRRIAPEMLDWQAWPAESVVPSFIVQETRPQAIKELTGSVVRSDIFTGEPINQSKIVRSGDNGLMAALLEPGMRAVTTRVSTDSAAGGFIMPGDRVDIVMTRQLPRENRTAGRNINQYAASTIFENVKVLAMNQTYSTGPTSPAALNSVSFATFELNQQDAELLEEAAEMGTISLTLRGIRKGPTAKSQARMISEEAQEASTMIVYRNGRQTQVAVRGQ